MVLIEGVGDEVTIFAGVLVLLSVLFLAWISTAVADRPLVSIVILDGRTFQQFIARLRGRNVVTPTEGNSDAGASDGAGTSEDNTPTEAPLLVPVEEVIAAAQAEPAAEGASATLSSSHPESEQEETGKDDDVPVSGQSTAASTPGSEGFEHVGVSSSEGEQEKAAPTTTQDTPSVPQCEPTSNELRQRRLAFFSYNMSQSDTAPQQQSATQSSDTTTSGQTQPTTRSGQTQSSTRPDPEPQSEPAQSGSTQEGETFTQLDGHIRIRIKYLDDRQRWVQARPEETIAQFKRAHFGSELTENTMVRFIYNGRELTGDGQSLASYNISDESVIHCLFSQVRANNADNLPVGAVMFDIGSLVFPLFGLILAVIWYSRFTYRQYFNTMSTLTLIATTFLFVVALLASLRPTNTGETAVAD